MIVKRTKRSIKKVIRSVQSLFNFYHFIFNDLKKIQEAEILFILPYFQTGGAERVHLNIVKSVKDKKLCILFTHNSATENFKKDFLQYAKIIEINEILTKKNNSINEFLKLRISKAINKSLSIKSIFASNTNFFYEILPQINQDIIKIDLVHAISNENKTIVEHYINSSDKINYRIVINKAAYNAISLNYSSYGVSKAAYKKLVIIENAIEIHENEKLEKRKDINIGFVGRWSKEKRPEIFLKIAKKIKKEEPSISFLMAGIGMKSNVTKMKKFDISFSGEITNDETLNSFYKSLTFLLITSYREGFPMVIIEAMAQGVIPISTNVGGISEHLTSFENGVLIDNSVNENEIVLQFVEVILKLIRNKEEMTRISINTFNYSKEHFNIKEFNKKYRAYLLDENNQ